MTSRSSFTAVSKTFLQTLFFAATLVGGFACSSAPKKEPELSRFLGKKIALVSLQAEPTAKTIVEVALVNQLVKRGTFILISQEEVQKAKAAHDVDTTDDAAVARRAGADYSLKARVLKFEAHEREGYDSIVEDDSQMEAETGESKTKRLYKVATLLAKVEIELTFRDLQTGELRVGIAKAEGNSFAESKTTAGHLPPKMGFLEKVANEAFRDFFDRYN